MINGGKYPCLEHKVRILTLLMFVHVDLFDPQSGKLQIFDVGSGGLLEEVEAHTGAVWSVSMSPDRVSDANGVVRPDKHEAIN